MESVSEREARLTKAVDAVLADDFLTGAVVRAVGEAVDAEVAEELRRTAHELTRDLEALPHQGRYTRAGWAKNWLLSRSNAKAAR